MLLAVHGCWNPLGVDWDLTTARATLVGKDALEIAGWPKAGFTAASTTTCLAHLCGQPAGARIVRDGTRRNSDPVPFEANLFCTTCIENDAVLLCKRLPSLNTPRVGEVSLLRMTRIRNANFCSTTFRNEIVEWDDLFVFFPGVVLVFCLVTSSCAFPWGSDSTAEETDLIIALDDLELVRVCLNKPMRSSVR